MLYEYAIEPQAIGSDWQTFRYVIEKFGFDKGRLISQFPKRWFRDVYQAAEGLPDMQRKRVEEALRQAKRDKVVRVGRHYNPDLGDWLDNALAEHQREPFRAILTRENRNDEEIILCTDQLDEQNERFAVPRDCAVSRDVNSLAAAINPFLRFCSNIVFVDPYFRPNSPRQAKLYFHCFSIVRGHNANAVCEIHYRYQEGQLVPEDLEATASSLFSDIIPVGMVLKVFCWKERDGGEDFHARYLLTERGGVRVDAGFDPVGSHQRTDMALMSYELSQRRLRCFSRDATVYELIEPVLRISGSGNVEYA